MVFFSSCVKNSFVTLLINFVVTWLHVQLSIVYPIVLLVLFLVLYYNQLCSIVLIVVEADGC